MTHNEELNGLGAPLGIDPMVLAAPLERQSRLPRSHWASSLAGCMRQAYFRWTGAPITDPASLIQRQKMEAGDLAAASFLRLFRENAPARGVSVVDWREEVPIALHPQDLRFPITGRVDFVLRYLYKQRDLHVGIEFKSTAGKQTDLLVGRYNQEDKWIPGSPMNHIRYVVQVWAYTLALQYVYPIDHFFLICWDRDTLLHTTYEFRLVKDELWWCAVPRFLPTEDLRGTWHAVNPELWQRVIARLQQIEACLDNVTLPPRFDPVTGEEMKTIIRNGEFVSPPLREQKKNENWWACRYCEYRSHCWLEKEEGACLT